MKNREKGNTVRKKRLWIIPVLVILLSCMIFLIYAGQYYHSDGTAVSALRSDETVTVTQTEYGWLFDGPSEDDALIFYPGARSKKQHMLRCFTISPDRAWMPAWSECRFVWRFSV